MIDPQNHFSLLVIGVFKRLGFGPDPCRPQQDIHIGIEDISPTAPIFIHNWERESWLGRAGYSGNVISIQRPIIAPLSREGSSEGEVRGTTKCGNEQKGNYGSEKYNSCFLNRL